MPQSRIVVAAVALILSFPMATPAASLHKLVVISVDGLDHRYLKNADALGLHIPNLRKLMAGGEWADGVVGVVPTITWPSHTTMMTGVRPAVHGIRGNRRPSSEGGQYYLESSLIRAPTLWHAVRQAGGTTAAITWPSTVGGPFNWVLPEAFERRRGGGMDLETIASKATPGLLGDISADYPSFPQQWMDDRTRTQAILYLLRRRQPDLLTVHLVDLDAEEHETGPFSSASKAIVEYTDELIGQVMGALPRDATLAIVSDHGFAKVTKVVQLGAALNQNTANLEITPAWVCARDEKAAAALEKARSDNRLGIGRAIPAQEWKRFVPEAAPCVAAYEPAEGVMFGTKTSGAVVQEQKEAGVHGLWPGRPDYRSVFVLWRQGMKPRRLPEMSMLDIAARFAGVLGVTFKPARE